MRSVADKIKMVRLADIVPYENNPRFNEEAVEKVRRSIERFGFLVPCVIGKGNVLAAGHTRLKAAKELGMDEVPCVVADDLTEEELNMFRLVDNRVAEFATWDWEKLGEELMGLKDGFDLGEFGFQVPEDPEPLSALDDLLDEEAEPKGPDTFRIIVDCDSEDEMKSRFDRITALGIEARCVVG